MLQFIKGAISIFILLLSLQALSQPQPQPQPTNKFNLPTVILPSPSAQNFMRYGEIPVDYSTGVPNINIPLYTARSRQLSLPISISYHASGIKVADKASIIGLGWVLNCGGLVTETLLSASDNAPAYNSAASLNAARLPLLASSNPVDEQIWALQMYNEMGAKPAYKSNRYTFSLPSGESGVFRYDYITGNVIKLPYSSVKITPENKSNIASSNGVFVITDEKGVSYTFKSYNSIAGQSGTRNITSMISADKTDTIRFTYKNFLNTYSTPAHTSALQLFEYPSPTYIANQYEWHTAINLNNAVVPAGNQTYEQLLDSVVTSNTIITYTYSGDRLDLHSYPYGYRLTRLSVYNRQSRSLIKSYSFNQNYFGSAVNNNQRLQLSGLTANDSNDAVIEDYSFVYEVGVELPPYSENNIGPYQFAEDYWGYYNGYRSYSKVPLQFVPVSANNTWGSYPTTFVDPVNYTNRDPNAYYAKAAMLKEIHYPTGGKTLFTFEPNQAEDAYHYPSNFATPTIVGGFRIKQVSNYSSDGALASFKSYTYNLGKTQPIRNELFTQVQRVFGLMQTYATNDLGSYIPTAVHYMDYPTSIISSDSFLPLTCDNGPPVLYTFVTELSGDFSGDNTGKTEYVYQTPPKVDNPHVGYDNAQITGSYFYDMGNYVPLILNKKTYKYLSSGAYLPVKEVQTAYTSFLTQSYPMGYNLLNLNDYRSSILYDKNYLNYQEFDNYGYSGTPIGYNGYHSAADLFIAQDVMATQQLSLPTQTKELTYNAADSTKYLTATTQYSYKSLTGYTLGSAVHTQPTQKTIINSSGDRSVIQSTYPMDLYAQQPYASMVSNNMLTPVVAESEYKNVVDTMHFLQSSKTEYSFWNNGQPVTTSTNQIYPVRVSSKVGSITASDDLRVNFRSYDEKGNIGSVSKTDGPVTSYLWGYNKILPTAMVTNALIGDVFFESFEDGVGNALNTAHTGHRYSTGNYIRTINGIANGRYVLSYWTKLNTNWQMQVISINITSGNYTINLSGQIDDVRFYPQDAQMTTYTYDPLIGMTSMTDPKGQTTYYEYDSFQRLHLVRDSKRKVVKEICYNYVGQAGGCPIIMTPVDQGPQAIYARIEAGNISSTAENGYDSWSVRDRADINIMFYSDEDCQHPLVLNSALDVIIITETVQDRNYAGQYIYTNTNTFHVPAGQSIYSLGRNIIWSSYTYPDPQYGSMVTDTETNTFKVVVNGTAYIPSPSI